MNAKTVCISANTSWNLVNFRGALIDDLREMGYRVVAISPRDEFTNQLSDLATKYCPIKIKNKGLNVFEEISVWMQYRKIYRDVKPDYALHFTIKPVIFGTFAAPRNCTVINTVTGLGTAFLHSRILRILAIMLLRVCSCSTRSWVFQNQWDKKFFQQKKVAHPHQAVIIAGAGVNIDRFAYSPIDNQRKIRFLYVGRILRDKGFYELIEASRIVKKLRLDIVFRVIGEIEGENRSAICRTEFDQWVHEGLIEYGGNVKDVRKEIIQASCVVLPSYREGLSRVLLEAGALGRPAITTDVPGCRDIVQDMKNGLLVSARSSDSLVQGLLRFYNLSHRARLRLGEEARRNVEKNFRQEIIIGEYKKLLTDRSIDQGVC